MPSDVDRRLAELIVERGLADPALRDLLLAQAEETGQPLLDLLVENEIITAEQAKELEIEIAGGQVTGVQQVPGPSESASSPPEAQPESAAPPSPEPEPGAPPSPEPEMESPPGVEPEEAAPREESWPEAAAPEAGESPETVPALEVGGEPSPDTIPEGDPIPQGGPVETGVPESEPVARAPVRRRRARSRMPKPANPSRGGWLRVALILLLLGEIGAVGYLYTQGHVPFLERFIPRAEEPPPAYPSDRLEEMYRGGDLEGTLRAAEQAKILPKEDPDEPDIPDPEAYYWIGRVRFMHHLRKMRLPGIRVRLGKVDLEPDLGKPSSFRAEEEAILEAFIETAGNARLLKKPHRMAMVETILAFLGGRWKDVVAAAEEVLEEDPRESDAGLLKAHALYRMGQLDSAAEAAVEQLTSPSAREAAVLLARIGHARAVVREATGRPPNLSAGQVLREAVGRIDPYVSHPDAASIAAECLLLLSDKASRRGEHKEAGELFQRAREYCERLQNEPTVLPALARVHEFSGKILLDRGRATEAADELRKAVEIYERMTAAGMRGPGVLERRGEVRLRLAKLYLSRGGIDRAVEAATEALEDLRKAAESGNAWIRVRAIGAEMFRKRIGQRRHSKIKETFAEHLKRLDEVGAAEDPYLMVERGRVALEFARYLFNREDADARQAFDTAVADLSAALKQEPGNATGYLLRAEALGDRARCLHRNHEQASADIGAALKDLDEALHLRPDLVEALLLRGNLEILRARADPSAADDALEKAVRAYTDLLQTQPKFALALVGRARARRIQAQRRAKQRGDSTRLEEQGLSDLKEALNINPELVEALHVRARFRLDRAVRLVEGGKDPQEEVDGVIADATHALRFNDKDTLALRLRGEAKLLLARFRSVPGSDPAKAYEGAVKDFSRVIALNPRDFTALWHRGEAHLLFGKFLFARDQNPLRQLKEAISDLTQALQLRPNDPGAARDRAHAYRLSADYHLSPKGDGRKNEADLQQCLRDATRALEVSPNDVRALWDRASCRFYLGQYEAAIEDYERIIEVDPSLKQKAQRQISYCKLALQRGR